MRSIGKQGTIVAVVGGALFVIGSGLDATIIGGPVGERCKVLEQLPDWQVTFELGWEPL